MASTSSAADLVAPAPVSTEIMLYMQNFTGRILPYNTYTNATVRELKLFVHLATPKFLECKLKLLRMCVILKTQTEEPNDQTLITLDDETRTLSSYGIIHEMKVLYYKVIAFYI